MVRPYLPVSVGLGAALVLSLTGPAAQAVPANLQSQVQAQNLAATAAATSGDAYASRTTVLADSFYGKYKTGWGSAPIGGRWTTWGNTYGDGIRGVLVNEPNTGQGALASGVSVRDHETRIMITPSLPPTSDLYVTFGHRQVGDARYELRLVFRPNGTADMQIVAKTANGEQTLAASKRDAFKVWAGKDIMVRFSAVGEGTTELGASIWEANRPEPSKWLISATDSTPELQRAGTLGVESWLDGGSRRAFARVNDWKTEEVVPHSVAAQPEEETPPAPELEAEPAPEASEEQKPDSLLAGLATKGDLATVPASQKGVGAVPLGQTNYAIPANAVHVKAGADATRGNGTAARPFATIQKAVYNTKPGQTIVVHDGVYHEYVGVFNDPNRGTNRDRITIQAAPGAEVWMDGSKQITSWTRSGSTWTASWQDHKEFNTIAGFGSTAMTGDYAFTGPQNPLAADASQVFVDGRQLQQVAANPGAGQFAVDRSNPSAKKLILGEDPAGKEVRASYLHQAIVSNANDLVVRGIGVRGYATPLNWKGTIYAFGERPVFENMVFDSLPTVALSLSNAKGGVARNNTFAFAGLNGIGSYHSDNVTLSGNYVYGANQQHFNTAPVAGGVKVTQSRDLTITGNEVTHTLGATGIWVDESVINFSVTDNRLAYNGSLGVHAEISLNAIIAGNEIVNNRSSGIEVLGTPNTWIANNYLAGNGEDGKASIAILQDRRRQASGMMGIDTRYPAPDPENTWITTNIRIVNNVLGEPHANALGQFDVHDRAGVSYADAMLTQVEGNVIVDRDTQNLARLGLPGHRARTYADLSAIRALHAEDWRTNTVRNSGTSAELQKVADGTRGVTLDATLAAVLGIPSGSTLIGIPTAK